MPVAPLTAAQLRRACDPNAFPFATTAELDPNMTIIGQPRGVRAIEFGIGIRSQGYNIFVLGEAGTGRTTAIRRFLREKTRNEAVPDDWVYVHNFKSPNEPRAIEFHAGQGRVFKNRLEELIRALRDEVPQVFATEAYRDEVERLRERADVKRELLLRKLEMAAEKERFALINTAAGPAVAPLNGDKVMDEATYDALPVEAQKALDKVQTRLEEDLEETMQVLRRIGDDLRQQLRQLDRKVAESALAYHFDNLNGLYADQDEVQLYLREVHDDVLKNLGDFRPNPEEDTEPDLRRYEVNLFVDNADIEGAPVVVEPDPTYYNLVGRIEFEMRQGVMTTHFTNIKPGSLHRANGGYIIVDAHDLISNQPAWDAVKRAIKEREVDLNPVERFTGGNVLAKTSDPEPIPLNVKVILLGSSDLYYYLYEVEEDFDELFKVKADFSTTMPRTPQSEMEYAVFIAHRCCEEKLRHFDASAVARAVEFGSWLAEHQNKLSTRFGEIADLVREASFWAGQRGGASVTADDVRRALAERLYRSNKVEEWITEQIESGALFIDTQGEVLGQLNGLMVLEYGNYAFAHPARISVQTFVGEGGVLHLDRETDMTDPIHNKGLLTLNGYLGGKYAQEQNLSMAASISFDQNYNDVAGDSASSAELYALLSSLSGLPLSQGVAVTGSINQRGEIQPIGAATEKVTGFYRVCKLQGLTGRQGVIIPAANVLNLMLDDELMQAVADGRFHIWAVRTIDEGLEILTGVPAGERDADGRYPEETVHGRVYARLARMARRKKADEEEEEEDEEEEDGDGDDSAESET